MANRFTDTEKWKDEWFLELEPVMKMLWIYMLDTCDYAGVWKVNFRLASYSIGTALDRQSALKALNGRIQILSIEKWHIPKFITFQYRGKLNPKNNAHKGALKLLEYHGIETRPYLEAPYDSTTNNFDSLGSKEQIQEQEQIQYQTKDSFKEEAEKNLPEIQPQDFRNPKVTPDQLIQLFNNILAGKGKISYCRGLSGKNIQEFITTTSYLEFSKIETWEEIFNKATESDFLKGLQQGTNFTVTLNWLVCHDNALKVLNGQYGGGGSENASSDLFGGIKDEMPEGA